MRGPPTRTPVRTVCTWLSIALCVIALIAWAAQLSPSARRAFAWSGGKNIYQIASTDGEFEAISMFGASQRTFFSWERQLNVAFISDYPETVFDRLGFSLAVRSKRGGGSDYIALPMLALRVPCWFVVSALAFLIFALWRFRKRRDLGAMALCPTCGYDLRASPDRCPECGHVVQPT